MSQQQFQTLLNRNPGLRAMLIHLICEQPDMVRAELGLAHTEPTTGPGYSPFTRTEMETARTIGWDD